MNEWRLSSSDQNLGTIKADELVVTASTYIFVNSSGMFVAQFHKSAVFVTPMSKRIEERRA